MSRRSPSPRGRSPPRRRSPSPRGRSRSPRRGGGGGRFFKGTATRWNDRGFGFITPEGGGDDVFCHFSQIKDGNCLREGDPVEFELVFDDRRGKDRAENVTGGSQDDSQGGGGKGGGAGECYAFRDGHCDRGDSCRFSHSGGGGGARGGKGGFDDRRGGDRYDDRRGGYDDRRGGYDDRRGGYDDRRGGYDDRRAPAPYDDRRGGGDRYDDRRGGGGGYDDRRGGGRDRY